MNRKEKEKKRKEKEKQRSLHKSIIKTYFVGVR